MYRALAPVLLALTLAAFPTGAAAKDKAIPLDHPLIKFVADLDAGSAREHRALLVVPLVASKADPPGTTRPVTAAEAVAADDLSVGEPKKNPGRDPLEVYNWSTAPILLMAGEVLEGGRRDRFFARSILLPPGQKLTVPAYPADRLPRPAAAATTTLRPVASLAPDLLRLVAITDGPRGASIAFLDGQFAMAAAKGARASVVDLLKAPALKTRMADYEKTFAAIPDEAQGRVIGAAAFVGDRFVGADLFPTNLAFRCRWPAMLKTLAFQASLFELSYGLLQQPFPVGRDPSRHTGTLKAFLRRIFAGRLIPDPKLGLGTSSRVVQADLRARLLQDDTGAVVHLVVMVDLSDTTSEGPPPPGGSREIGYAGMEIRDKAGLLNPYERRLLERMRSARQGAPGPGLPGRK